MVELIRENPDAAAVRQRGIYLRPSGSDALRLTRIRFDLDLELSCVSDAEHPAQAAFPLTPES